MQEYSLMSLEASYTFCCQTQLLRKSFSPAKPIHHDGEQTIQSVKKRKH